MSNSILTILAIISFYAIGLILRLYPVSDEHKSFIQILSIINGVIFVMVLHNIIRKFWVLPSLIGTLVSVLIVLSVFRTIKFLFDHSWLSKNEN